MELLGVGRIAAIATVGMLALSGCQATQGEAPLTVTSSPTASTSLVPEALATVTSEPEETTTAWAVSTINSADQCSQFTEAMSGDLLDPELVTFRSIFFGAQGDKFVQLENASDFVCNWTPTKSAEQKWRETSLHIATIPASEDFDAASTFDEFESSAEGESLGSTAYTTEPLGDGTVYMLEDLVHGETVNADICHYVEGKTVVSITRESDGQCVAVLEKVLAIAKA